MTFGEWFTAQYGKRPSDLKLYDILKLVGDAEYELARLRALHRACEMWDEQAKSALYAWNIDDAGKGG